MFPVGGDIAPRIEHKSAVPAAGMRNEQCAAVGVHWTMLDMLEARPIVLFACLSKTHCVISEAQEIDVERSGAPPERAVTTEFCLNQLGVAQQLTGSESRLQQCDRVYIGGAGIISHRPSFEIPAASNELDFRQKIESGQSSLKDLRHVPDVTSKRNGGCRVHASILTSWDRMQVRLWIKCMELCARLEKVSHQMESADP